MSPEPKSEDSGFAVNSSAAPLESGWSKNAAPRVWTVFVIYLAALAGAVAAQMIVVIGLVVWHLANGADIQHLQEDLPAMVTTPAAFIILNLPVQLVIGLAAIIPAWLSREPALSRLGLVAPTLPAWGYPVLMLGALFPAAVGLGLAGALTLVLPPDSSVEKLYAQMTWPLAVPFILFIALAPGFMEELLFRGYIQRRLLQRWSAWTAILVTSVLFGIMHIMPHAMVFAFTLGIWLGVLAWRTGSVWPSIACHVFINGIWNIGQIGYRLAGPLEAPPTVVILAGSAVVLGCFFGSFWIMTRKREAMEPSAGREDLGG